MSSYPKVAIIILNWNGLADTLACLASLQKLDYPDCRLVVVDNGSTDGSAAAIRAAYPHLTLVETGDNLGFVGGNNIGLEYAREMSAGYALLLNNDTEVAPDFLRRLVEAAEANPAAGMAGPTIYYFDRPDVIWSAGGAINRRRGCTRMVGLDELDGGQFGLLPRPVDFVTGCALLVKMTVVERVGPLDPRFFAYYEEAEWCVRAARAGFTILHVPRARVWHKISPVAREASPQVHYYMTRNRLLFLRLAQMGLPPWLYTLFFDYGRTLLSWTLKPGWQHKSAQRRAMWQALMDFGRGRFGRVTVTRR